MTNNTSKSGSVTLKDFWDEIDPRAHRGVEITTDDEFMTLDGHYAIAWERIGDPLKLVAWILHLAEKSLWLDHDDLRRIILTVCDHKGWQIPWRL